MLRGWAATKLTCRRPPLVKGHAQQPTWANPTQLPVQISTSEESEASSSILAPEPQLSSPGNMKSLSLTLVLAASLAAAIHVQPPENKWTRLNKSATLKCKSSDPIQTCSWMTPTGSIVTLNKGQQAEGGRLKYYKSDSEEHECGILIDVVEDKDVGAWTCIVGISLDDTEVRTLNGKANVSLATKPSAVRLSPPSFEPAAKQQDVSCIVNDAQPKPVFTWYVGDEELQEYPVRDTETEEEGVRSWVQTLQYSPKASHANQTLRCVD